MCETPQPRHEIARGKNRILGKNSKAELWGETGQKLSENTGNMLNKYPASFKQTGSVFNHTAADKNNRILGKAEKKFVEENKPKLGC